MKKKIVTFIIGLTALSLVGVVVTQLYWVKKAIDLKEEQFDESVLIGLKSVSNQLMELYNDSTLRKIKEEGPQCVIEKTDIRDIINSRILDSLIQEEMGCFKIEQDYEYAVINQSNNQFIMGTYSDFSEKLLISKLQISLKPLYKPGNYALSIYFPYQKSIILSQMVIWLILSGFFILVVILTFTITIYLFIRQKRLSEMKTDFVNNMTHEFKTPIATISLSSEMLLNPNVSKDAERTRKYAKVIFDENARLQNQVERILQIAILDKGEMKIKKKELDLHKTILKVVESFSIVIGKREGTVTTSLQAKNSVLFADKMHMVNIVSNLLDNANKYTPEKPQIIVSTKNLKSGILLSIEDNGIGISK
jgi:two-component system phosphate regulon sensor histidine kinase PhoR